MRILLTISYDGTQYVGWQKQTNGISIQETLENALSKLYNEKIVVIGASRTDSGVHARCQKAVYDVSKNHLPLNKLHMVINSKLPKDIAVLDAEYVADDFHPRFFSKQKTYSYTIHNTKTFDPLARLYSWHLHWDLDPKLMEEALNNFKGTHDFKGFCSTGTVVKNTVRTIYKTEMEVKGELIIFKITGNGFLYNMIRIMIGTLVRVGSSRIKPCEIKDIIESKDRSRAGKTAPPEGLCLEEIKF